MRLDLKALYNQGFSTEENLLGAVLKRQEGLGNGKRYHIHTFGCQMNLADSERMAGVLDAAGYQNVVDPDAADVLIYNTCSIREKAEDKVYSAMGSQVHTLHTVGSHGVQQVKRKRRQMRDLKIIIAGCMAKQAGEAILRRVPEVDIIMGPHYANQIEDLLDQAEQGSQVIATEEIEIEEDIAKPRRSSDITAWVNAIYGCNERCTYCVVPNARGQEQSRTPDAIKQEMTLLGQQGKKNFYTEGGVPAPVGYKEVTLLGQNIDAYGRDLPGLSPDGSGRRAWTFTDLLHYVHDVPGIARIRFATSHPRYFTERLIQACAALPKLCPFFHIPFQSGNNQILREMRRGYTHERYHDVIDNVRRYMPDASISGDAIVGFPGETESQFEDTLQLVRDLGFDRVNTAAYSPRPHTPAAVRDDQVADLIKMDRLNRLNGVVLEVASQRAQRFANRELEVLVEGVNPKKAWQAMGRTGHNKIAFFDGDGLKLKGTLVKIKVHDVKAYTLYGTRM